MAEDLLEWIEDEEEDERVSGKWQRRLAAERTEPRRLCHYARGATKAYEKRMRERSVRAVRNLIKLYVINEL